MDLLTTLPLNFPWQVLITQTRYCEDDRGAFELSLAERYELDLIYCHLSMLSSTAVPFSYNNIALELSLAGPNNTDLILRG